MPRPQIDTPQSTHTLSLEEFWHWLMDHCNCVLRVGTPDSILYDDEDYHWRFTNENPRTLLIQLVRGKRLVGEVFVEPEFVSSVRVSPGDKDEVIFDLMAEADGEEQVLYYFVMSHGVEADTPSQHDSLH
ncbi:hypothetical protein PVT68_17655 [Microbulbifer bruguierae]|uniref:Uncharacterized protein n=1 Tax=Microbulbifer bruguierae TaxID=3029061 RepID=A0ABY8NCD0_9GAMM|nr:hypothetical protein [Microbulbifer bruguierae]WGL16575.1 hypothetical protein PVT68_17655 [Microbulbifer bruguierae]